MKKCLRMERKTTMILMTILVIGIILIGTWWFINIYNIEITQNQKGQGQNTQLNQGQQPMGRPPQKAIDACNGKNQGSFWCINSAAWNNSWDMQIC